MKIPFEKVVLRELAYRWNIYAAKFKWKGRMNPPIFKLHAVNEPLARWRRATREMSFSQHLVSERSWAETLEVLKHEMAHQFCDEVLHSDDMPHGKTFQSVCHQHAIDASPRGIPDALPTAAPNHIVEKIRHLLSLAKSDNEHEAKRAAEAAHNLMLKYNIELREQDAKQNYIVRCLGRPAGRIQSHHSKLACLLRDHYFVQIIWTSAFNPRTGRSGHELEVSGTQENVDVAEYIHDFLTRAADDAWRRTRASKRFEAYREDELVEDPFGPSTPRGYTLSARFNFLRGFIDGFVSQLKDVRVEEEKAGLVLAKDPALEEFFRQRHPHTHRMSGGGGYANPTWRLAGKAEGERLRIPTAACGPKPIPLLGR